MDRTTEPTASETAPRRFAFLVHPRAQIALDMARMWRPLGRIPEDAWQWGFRHLPIPAQPYASIRRRDSEEPDAARSPARR
jgi:fatty aldehyde-generating acyl-ACP reductase